MLLYYIIILRAMWIDLICNIFIFLTDWKFILCKIHKLLSDRTASYATEMKLTYTHELKVWFRKGWSLFWESFIRFIDFKIYSLSLNRKLKMHLGTRMKNIWVTTDLRNPMVVLCSAYTYKCIEFFNRPKN